MPLGATPSRWCVCQFHHFRTTIAAHAEFRTRVATTHKLPKNVYRGQIEYTKLSAVGKTSRAGIEHNCGIPAAIALRGRNSGIHYYHFTIFENDSGLRLAAPPSAPSMPSCESNVWAFSGLTLPP